MRNAWLYRLTSQDWCFEMRGRGESHGGGFLYPKAFSALKVLAVGVGLLFLGNTLFLGLNIVESSAAERCSPSSEGSLAEILYSSDGSVRIDSERVMSRFSEDAPSSFKAEVMDERADWCSADDQGVIAGFVVAGDKEATAKQVGSALEGRGWRSVPSGQASVATFVKSSGEFRWATVSLSFFGEETSVMVNARRGA